MAKLGPQPIPDLLVLLTLKSELWQSIKRRRRFPKFGLLTLKSELWQSYQRQLYAPETGLLTLKSELWQSFDIDWEIAREVCSH